MLRQSRQQILHLVDGIISLVLSVEDLRFCFGSDGVIDKSLRYVGEGLYLHLCTRHSSQKVTGNLTGIQCNSLKASVVLL